VLFGNGGQYEAPRRLLRRVPGLRLVEMERQGMASYCCGAGGGAAQAFPEFAAFAGEQRLKEARATGAETVVTACGGCQRHLGAVAAMQPDGPRVTGLFQRLARAARLQPLNAQAETAGRA
jgi:Fe-S oxidoreductase